jgi:hypothetical protein
MSQSVVTMLKVTRQFEDVASEAAKRRKSLMPIGGDHNNYDDHHHHNDGDDDNEDNANSGDAEAAEQERNRLRASELLARANVVFSPVVFHPGKLRVQKKKNYSNTTNNKSPIQNNNNVSSSKTPNPLERSQMRRRSSIGGPAAAWHPSQHQNQNKSKIVGSLNDSFNESMNSGNIFKVSSWAGGGSGLGANSVVKQISDAPNLSSGAKLYYLRQRLATLQQESEAVGGGQQQNKKNVAKKSVERKDTLMRGKDVKTKSTF